MVLGIATKGIIGRSSLGQAQVAFLFSFNRNVTSSVGYQIGSYSSKNCHKLEPSLTETSTMHRWIKDWVGLSVMMIVASGGAIGLAQTAKPDANGDYSRNETSIQGKVPSGSKLVPGSLWRVVSPVLNCRRQPNASSPIRRQYKAGDILQVEVYRGGSDEVLLNTKDATGKPWMSVRATSFKLNDACYVRANQRYIQPVTK